MADVNEPTREQLDAWLTEHCGTGLPHGDATDRDGALHGLAYILRQIESTSSYKVHIGQCNSAMSALRWALNFIAAQSLRAAPPAPIAEGVTCVSEPLTDEERKAAIDKWIAPPAMDREAVACPTCGDTSPLEECATCGAYPTRTTTLSADAIRQGEGWRIEDGKPITDAPYACHVLAGRLDHDTGEWIMAVVASPPIYPFTHWWSLPDLPATPASHASDGGKA